MSGYLKKQKHTIDEVADIIEEEGIGYAIPKVPVASGLPVFGRRRDREGMTTREAVDKIIEDMAGRRGFGKARYLAGLQFLRLQSATTA